MNLTERVGKQNKAILLLIGLGLLAGITVGYIAVGGQRDWAIFYLLPISFFACFLGRMPGLIISFVSIVGTMSIDRTISPRGQLIARYWDGMTWLALYIFFVLMSTKLRSLYERERRFSRVDSLTNIPKRRSFLEYLEVEHSRARRNCLPLSIT